MDELMSKDPTGRALFSYSLNAIIDPKIVFPFNSDVRKDLRILFETIALCPEATAGDFYAESGKGRSYNFMDGGYKSAEGMDADIHDQCEIEFKKYKEIKAIALMYGRGLINFHGPGGCGDIYSPLWLSKEGWYQTGNLDALKVELKDKAVALHTGAALALLDATIKKAPKQEGDFLSKIAELLRTHVQENINSLFTFFISSRHAKPKPQFFPREVNEIIKKKMLIL